MTSENQRCTPDSQPFSEQYQKKLTNQELQINPTSCILATRNSLVHASDYYVRALKIQRFKAKKLHKRWNLHRFPKRIKNASLRVRRGGKFLSSTEVSDFLYVYGKKIIHYNGHSYTIDDKFKNFCDENNAVLDKIKRRDCHIFKKIKVI